MAIIGTLLKRDIHIAFSNLSGIVYPLLFFIMAISLFPLAIGSEAAMLQKAGSGIIWVMALLASLLPLSSLFEEDHADGTLEQLMLAGILPSVIAMTKITAYWLVAVMPLILAAPFLALMLQLKTEIMMMTLLSLLLGTPTLCLINGMMASLMLGAKQSSGLIFLITLPLTVPVLIFGTAAASAENFVLGTTALTALIGLLLIIAPISITLCANSIKSGNV